MKIRTSIAALAIAFVGPLAATAQDGYDRTDLYSVDLHSGASTLIGSIDDNVDGMAITSSRIAYLLTDDDTLLRVPLGAANGGVLQASSSVQVSGLGAGENLVGIDIRPATDQLFGISDASVIYGLDVNSGQAIAPGPAFTPALEDDSLGFDFNPTVDRIRVDVSTTQNLRLNPDTGAVGTNPDTGAPTIDGNLAFAADDSLAGATPVVVGAGYTNSVAGASATQLYVIDSLQEVLALQDPPNDGTLNTVGPLGVNPSSTSAFDIAPDGFAVLTVSVDGGESPQPGK